MIVSGTVASYEIEMATKTLTVKGPTVEAILTKDDVCVLIRELLEAEAMM